MEQQKKGYSNDLFSQKPNFGNFNIPINNLKTPSPSNAPAQNESIGAKILGSIGGGVSSGIGGLGKIIGSNGIGQSVGGFINASNASSANQKKMGMADAGVDAVANAASAFGPIGAAVGAGLKLVNSIGGSFVKSPESIKDFGINEDVSSGYSGVTSEAQDTQSDIDAFKQSGLAGKLFGKNSISNMAKISTGKQFAASQISNEQNKIKGAAANSMDLLAQNTTNKLNRNNPGLAILSKKGGSIPKFSKGGSIIVSGSLHARKHDLDKSKGLLKDVNISDKGVPVILMDKNGGEMVAEFEREELILRKDIIKEICDLRDEYKEEDSEEKKNDILEKIGKILTKEILSKTKDKDNLIDNIE